MSKSRSGAPRRVAAGLLAGALSVFGIALAPSAGAVDDVSGDRIAGINRYATAAAVAGQDDFAAATTAILATGETFPDALAASGLAGANAPAPIILTESDTYSDEAAEALNNLTSITDVVIVGGTAAVSQDVEDAVEADGFTVTRVAGANRFETAAAIAGEIATIGEVDGLVTALVATGTGFADALAGGPLAYAGDHPILLTNPTELPAATSDAITDLGIEQVIILGGTAAVSDDIAAELEDLTGNPAVRAAGENRFGTAAAVGEFAVTEFGWAPTEVLLAYGLNFPDALSGGPLGGARMAPIVLTASLPEESQAFLDEHSDTITDVTALGGTGVIDEETLDAAEAAAEEVENDDDTPTNQTVTTRPELVSATIVETRTAAQATGTRPAGTYVLYCFDEAITGATPDATDFFMYYGDGTRFTGLATDTDPLRAFTSGISSTDNKCAEILFEGGAAGSATDLRTAAGAANLTLATVRIAGVTDQGGATNPEGDAPLTPAGGGTAAAAGVTSAPDLVSVGNFRPGTTADVTAVDFTFDAAAFVKGGQFQVIGVDGVPQVCNGPASGSTTASGQAAPGGEGTTVITVNCAEPAGSVQHTAENTARGVVGAGAVGSSAAASSTNNPLQAADVAASGNSSDPDLSLAVFAPDAVAGVDVVAYIFDENVQAGTVPIGGGVFAYAASGSFGIYTTGGAEAFAISPGGCSRSGENNSAVTCGFTDNTLAGATYVGANVRAGAVIEADGINTNEHDEVGVAPSAGPSAATAGTTDGPDLTGVAINTVVSPFGTTSYTATYTFDEDVADTADTATVSGAGPNDGGNNSAGENVLNQLFHLWLSDGIRLDCSTTGISTTGLTARTEETDHQVTCGGFIVGTGGAAATATQVGSAVLGTVEYGAADDEATGGDTSPEGAAVTTGGNGTPAS